ncbi:hypothetical protein EV368DRAFT_88437 [Lentinula lateritia]|nr:hypothetical protein EV368DRAFT_88437 [Lentinula lateritia]
MLLPLSHLLLSLLLLASPTLITLGRASPLPTPPISSTSPISSPVNPSTTAPTHTPTSSSLSSLALNTTLPHPSFDPEEASTPLSPRSLNLPRWPSPPSVLQSTMRKLTDEKRYVLLGFSYTGQVRSAFYVPRPTSNIQRPLLIKHTHTTQLAGTQHDKTLFPLDQLQLPGLGLGLTPNQPGDNENENEDLVLLQKPSIQDPKGLYWKVSSRCLTISFYLTDSSPSPSLPPPPPPYLRTSPYLPTSLYLRTSLYLPSPVYPPLSLSSASSSPPSDHGPPPSPSSNPSFDSPQPKPEYPPQRKYPPQPNYPPQHKHHQTACRHSPSCGSRDPSGHPARGSWGLARCVLIREVGFRFVFVFVFV